LDDQGEQADHREAFVFAQTDISIESWLDDESWPGKFEA
jgi:hypothetical protein